MSGPGCFSDAEVQAFLLGDLPERVSQAVSAHLDACESCAALADQCDGLTDPMIRSLRQAHLSCLDSAASTGDDTTDEPNRAARISASVREGALPRVAGCTILEELGRGRPPPG